MTVGTIIDAMMSLELNEEQTAAFVATLTGTQKEAVKKSVARREKAMNEPEEDVAEDEGAKKYNGEGNPMKLRKMCKERGIDAEAKQKAPFYVALLLEDDKKGGKKDEKVTAKKETTKASNPSNAEKITEENFDPEKMYTKEQYENTPARTLYNIARRTFDIPRSELGAKPDMIKALMQAQGSGNVVSKEEPKQEKEEAGTAYDDMKIRALYEECISRGIKVEKKQERKVYVDLLIANDEEQAAEVEAEEEETTLDYDSMTARQLYDECRKRDITCEPKQDKSVYKEILEDDDAEADEPEEEESWGDTAADGEDWDL